MVTVPCPTVPHPQNPLPCPPKHARAKIRPRPSQQSPQRVLGLRFVGCKRQAQEAVREAADACGQFYVNHRWLGGTLTNLETIRKSIARLGYLEEIEKKPEFKSMSKKELASLNRERIKLERNLRGIRGMEKHP
jgi:ribosomal protein S2